MEASNQKQSICYFIKHICQRLQLTQLCVTNDLIVFTDLPSIQVIKGALVEFKNMSGLNADVRKSERVFFFG